MLIEIPVAVAELFDKISILEIKLDKIPDAARQKHIQHELAKLSAIARNHGIEPFLDDPLYRALKSTNETLWDVCEVRRELEKSQVFDEVFIKKSRLEYSTNDQRALIKQQINEHFNSTIVEVKSYEHLNSANN